AIGRLLVLHGGDALLESARQVGVQLAVLQAGEEVGEGGALAGDRGAHADSLGDGADQSAGSVAGSASGGQTSGNSTLRRAARAAVTGCGSMVWVWTATLSAAMAAISFASRAGDQRSSSAKRPPRSSSGPKWREALP